MLVYATTQDLATWVETVPDNADTLLRSASLRIARAANRDAYTDEPTAEDAAVLKDATCAQVQSWVALGIDPAAGGLDSAPIKRSTMLGDVIEQDTTGQAAGLQLAAADLAPLARDILQQSGLLWLPTALGDEQPFLYGYGLAGPPVPCDPYSWGAQLAEWPFV